MLSDFTPQNRPQDDNISTFSGHFSSVLDSLIVGYDKRLRPNYGGSPVYVGVTMHVLSISALSELKMDFTSEFYFLQFWTDPRLAFENHTGIETLSVGPEFIQNIWVPDTFFANEKHSYVHTSTTRNDFIRIHYTGSITRSIRLTVTASCPMDLKYFPMDRQLCTIQIGSYGYDMREIRYKWNQGPNSVEVSSEVSLPEFKVYGHRQRAMEISLSTGNYSRLEYDIQFVRSMGYYLIQIYIPSCMIVVISWVSFWLNRGATPARVSLSVTTGLAMTTLMSNANSALPKVSYVKSIDVYLGTCFIMVFISLLEYAAVEYIGKRIRIKKNRYLAAKKKQVDKNIQVEDLPAPSDLQGPIPSPQEIHLRGTNRSPSQHPKEVRHDIPPGPIQPSVPPRLNVDEESQSTPLAPKMPKELNMIMGFTPSDIDKYSRVVFPVVFVCFNLIYWLISLHISDILADDLILLH